MRIAMLTNNYKPVVGGVPISIERLSESLRQLGHEVYIFAPTYENQEEEEGVIRYKSFKHKLDDEVTIPYVFDKGIEEQFKELDIDVIHVHHPHFVGWMATYLGKKYNVPVVYTYHTRYEQYIHYIKGVKALEDMSKNECSTLSGFIANGILKKMREHWVPDAVRRYANKCDGIIAPTALMKDVLQEMGVKARINILPTGIDECFFQQEVSTVNSIRNKYIGDKQYLFCTVSRLAKEKNINFLIDGLVRVKAQIGNTFRMIVIGDGPIKNELTEQIKSLGLEENVVLIGNVPNQEIKHYYGACDLFLFASQSETQGIVLVEAMAAGLPVIAVEASGVVDVVKNGVNGFMTNSNLEEWSRCVGEIILDKEKMNILGEGAYETARYFTGKEVAKSAMQCYNRTIKNYYIQTKSIAEEKVYA